MLFIELPTGITLDFDTTEALARAPEDMRASEPLVVCDEHDGTKQVWAPGDGR